MKFTKTVIASSIVFSALTGFGAAHASDTDTSGATVTRAQARKANHQLESAVRKQLTSQHIDSANVNIVARSGKVFLEGTVAQQEQIALVGNAAQGVPGVKAVKNSLTVQEAGN
jgi:hyperosmotically inducible periplasmic protein